MDKAWMMMTHIAADLRAEGRTLEGVEALLATMAVMVDLAPYGTARGLTTLMVGIIQCAQSCGAAFRSGELTREDLARLSGILEALEPWQADVLAAINRTEAVAVLHDPDDPSRSEPRRRPSAGASSVPASEAC